MLKKLRIGAWLSLVAAVAGLVGVIALIVSNGIDSAYALKSIGALVAMGVIGVALCAFSFWSPSRFGNHDYISTAGTLGAIALFMAIVGTMVSDRVLMIAGLFSYNSQNMVGWSVFYAMVVSAVALVIACLVLIVGAFTKNGAENA